MFLAHCQNLYCVEATGTYTKFQLLISIQNEVLWVQNLARTYTFNLTHLTAAFVEWPPEKMKSVIDHSDDTETAY